MGMVEILVTLFILTVGLLGVASLQFVSAFSNADALHRSQAVLVAQQFSERLRAAAEPYALVLNLLNLTLMRFPVRLLPLRLVYRFHYPVMTTIHWTQIVAVRDHVIKLWWRGRLKAGKTKNVF